MSGTRVRDILRQAGLRSTPQRIAIVRAVLSRSHPTVGEIYESVRRGFPTIGLQTVYSTLHAMTERGLVSELPFSSATRFDTNMRPHANLVCRDCGGIEDAEFAADYFDALLQPVVQPSGFTRDTQRIDVYGQCRTCATTESATARQGSGRVPPGIVNRAHFQDTSTSTKPARRRSSS